MAKGEQVRDFVAVQDVAQQLMQAAQTPGTPGSATFHHIGTGTAQTLRQFAETWWQSWDATGTIHFGAKPYRDDEVMRYVPDMSNSLESTGHS